MTARILYYSFVLQHAIVITLLYVLLPFLKKRRKGEGIAALPYYPKDWPGGKDRIAAWKPLFEKEGIRYDLFPCWSSDDIREFFDASNDNKVLKKYRIYRQIYWSRIKLLFKLSNYEAVWIQRAYIPLFPFKQGYYEKLLSKLHPNVTYDFYDADYESNYKLVMDTVKHASKVTVASNFLLQKHKKLNSNTYFLRYSISTDQFLPHTTENQEIITIGWMGSPENAKQLVAIKNQLKRIEDEFPTVQFSFVCRDLPDLELEKITVQKWGDQGFDYYKWMSTLNIGIVPFLDQTDRVKAKISMKNLEFMVAAVPQVVSPHVHSDVLKNNESCIIANENEWYLGIKHLIENPDLRKSFSVRSNELYQKDHAYEEVYSELKEVLFMGQTRTSDRIH